MSTMLRLTFVTAANGTFNLYIPNPREDILEAEVVTAMETIMNKNIFATGTGTLVALKSAEIITIQKTKFDVA